MQTRQLTEGEFKATMTPKMHDVTAMTNGDVDIWPYVSAVPATELEGHSIYDRFVDVVYRSDDDRFDHVLVMTKTKNVYLAVVVDVAHGSVYGHRLLDLNREYGLTPVDGGGA